MKTVIKYDKDEYKTIDRQWTNRIPVGYCTHHIHRGYVTTRICKTRGCADCPHFRKNLNHEYWSKDKDRQGGKNKKKPPKKKNKIFY